jgi:hypothetical protein
MVSVVMAGEVVVSVIMVGEIVVGEVVEGKIPCSSPTVLPPVVRSPASLSGGTGA